MAGWSVLSNVSALNSVEKAGFYRGNGDCQVLHHIENGNEGSDGCINELRGFFYQLLLIFFKEESDRGIVRPIPPVLGDAGSVDLFKLLWVVSDRGGYRSVTKMKLWSLVVEELGLDPVLSASVKLIYHKYLRAFKKWFKESYKAERLENGKCGFGFDRNLHLLPLELEAKFRRLLFHDVGGQGLSRRLFPFKSKEIENHLELPVLKSEQKSDSVQSAIDLDRKTENAYDDILVIQNCDDEDNSISSGSTASTKEKGCHKRKRERLSGMLEWLIQIAKHPGDPSIGLLPERYKWKKHCGNEFWFQALKARDALLLKKHFQSTVSLIKKKLKMHPSMYEDTVDLGLQLTESLECCTKLHDAARSCSGSCLAARESENTANEQADARLVLSAGKDTVSSTAEDTVEKQVSIGPLYQVEVPEWTGVVSDSDSKWLGTRVWPLDYQQHDSSLEIDHIGTGRAESCSCRLPGSVECFRFHIAEERMKLKLELGPVFYHWRVDNMGEEVSLRWTAEEEQQFKDLAMRNRSSHSKCFWDKIFDRFPMKTREDLVRYYFNVFLVRMRSYQNRATPENIDSDDEEADFGSFGSFGSRAAKFLVSGLQVCSENKQLTDFD